MSSTFSGSGVRTVRIRNSTQGVSTVLAAVIVVIVVAIAAGATYFEATSNMHTATTTLTIGSTLTSTQSGSISSTTATVISTSISTSATTIASTTILTQTQTVTAPSQNVRDIAGDYVSIPTNISRISVGWYALNTMVFAMGGENKIVTGMQYNGHPWASLIFPSATNVTSAYNSTSGALNVETLLGANPQVFLTNIGDSNVQLTESVGIPTLQFEMENYSQEMQTVTLLGNVLGGSTPDRAQLFNSYLNNMVNSINSTISSNSSISRPSVSLIEILPGPTYYAIGAGYQGGSWINFVGGNNSAGNIIVSQVNIEQILAWNSSIVFFINGGTANYSLSWMQQDPEWSQMGAVKDGQVYPVPDGVASWIGESSETVLGLQWGADIIHPNLFHYNMVNQTQYFYKTFYGYNLTVAQANEIVDAEPPS